MVYLNLQMGNESFHSLESSEKLFAKRWVWGKTTSEPMLSFPVDYDIYSLGLLNYQVRYMNVHLEEQPPGCLARLNTSCQDNVVAKTLLRNFTKVNSGSHLAQTDCVRTIYTANSIGMVYHCCREESITEMKDPLVRCGLSVQTGSCLHMINAVYYIFLGNPPILLSSHSALLSRFSFQPSARV